MLNNRNIPADFADFAAGRHVDLLKRSLFLGYAGVIHAA